MAVVAYVRRRRSWNRVTDTSVPSSDGNVNVGERGYVRIGMIRCTCVPDAESAFWRVP